MVSFSKLPYHAGVKVQVYPSDNQKRIIEANINGARFAYNELVALNKELYELKRVKTYIKIVDDRIKYLERLTSGEFGKLLQQRHPWLHASGVGSAVITQADRRYHDAWNMFRKVHTSGVPVFKKKKPNNAGSFQFSNLYPKITEDDRNLFNGNNCILDQYHLKLSLLGRIRVGAKPKSKKHYRPDSPLKRFMDLPQNIRIATVTVSKTPVGKYYVSFQLGSDQPMLETLTSTNHQIGIDLNTENFLTTSDGEIVPNPRFYRRTLPRLRREQNKLSRRMRRAKAEGRELRNSRNYQKQRQVVAQLHERVTNQRHTFLENLAKTLVKNQDLVVVEKLQGKNLLKNHALAMSISDVGWSIFTQQLVKKATQGDDKEIRFVNPKNTTQTCSTCGYLMQGDEKLTLKDRKWTCPACATMHIRDINAAKNILTKGLAN